MSPLVPTATDGVFAVAALLNAILVLTAIAHLVRFPRRGWLAELLLVLFVPLVGPAVSIVASRHATTERTSSGAGQ